MFLRKFLSRVVYMKPLEDETGSGGSSFDIESAMGDIADGLGFNTEIEDEGDGNGTNADLDSAAGDSADKSGAPADGAAPAADAAQKPADAPAAEAPADGTGQHTPPRTWRPDAAAKWATLPPEVQAEVLKREEDMFKGIEGYKAHATTGKAFQDALAPFSQKLQAAGADPVALTRELMAVHMVLATGQPEQKQQLAQQLLAQYGVQLPQPDGIEPFIDPQVKALQQELAAVKSQLNGTAQQTRQITEARQAEVRNKLAADVDAFERDPKNIYFAEVAGLIPQILQSGLAKDLPSAYEYAVMANPVTQQKELARRTAEMATKQAQEVAAKAEAAKKATSANVKARARNASGTAPLGSIDDTLTEAYARLMSKQ